MVCGNKDTDTLRHLTTRHVAFKLGIFTRKRVLVSKLLEWMCHVATTAKGTHRTKGTHRLCVCVCVYVHVI